MVQVHGRLPERMGEYSYRIIRVSKEGVLTHRLLHDSWVWPGHVNTTKADMKGHWGPLEEVKAFAKSRGIDADVVEDEG